MDKKKVTMVMGGIIVLMVLIAIVAGFFFFQDSNEERCGDGVCDNLEIANPNLCPNDCEMTPSLPSTQSLYQDSPFGFHPGNAEDYLYLRDLGVEWSREGMYVRWDWVDVNRDGSNTFTEATALPKPNIPHSGGNINYDEQWLKVPENVNIIANVCPFVKGGNFGNSEEPDAYQQFVEKMVERYDGDTDYGCMLSAPDCYKKGDSQYPDSKIIEAFKKNPIKYWQVCNQVLDVCAEKDCKKNYASSFALVQEKTYNGVKAADSSAYVLMAGDSAKELYPEVFNKLNGNYVDIIDFHRFGVYGWYNPKSDFDYLKTNLQFSGFDIGKLRFWITETGTYSGTPAKDKAFGYQSEKQQAEGLVKAYISAFSYGIEKVFWAWNIVEGFQGECGFFDYTGLVYDGCDCVDNKFTCDLNVGYDNGKGVKKLSYYSYKKMVEVLDGSDWNNIQAIQESGGIYIYKFAKNGKPIWVAWNDNSEAKTISLDVGNAKSIKITEAIPKYNSGKEVTDYNNAFNTGTGKFSNGKLAITIGSSPVYIEESSENLAQYSPTVYLQVEGQTSLTQGTCGDGICSGPETNTNCPVDCKSATSQPPTDGTTEQCIQTCIASGKAPPQCLQQCLCGDGVCDSAETSVICPADCSSTTTTSQGRCGDGICDDIEITMGECSADCP